MERLYQYQQIVLQIKLPIIPYYEAKVELTKEGEEELKKHGFTLVAGMPATVMIQTGTRTVAQSYFIKPFKIMVMRAFNEE